MQVDTARPILLVSRQAPWAPAWAEVETSAQAGLALWHERRHRYVFADLGDLGSGMTGARLATELRKQDAQGGLVIVLMVDLVQPHHAAWASRSGANGVIERTLDAMVSALPPDIRALSAGTEEPAIGSHAPSLQAIAALVESRLQAHGRMGPVRSIVVADAIDEITSEHPGVAPTALEVARRVASQIASPADRGAFLKSLRGDSHET